MRACNQIDQGLTIAPIYAANSLFGQGPRADFFNGLASPSRLEQAPNVSFRQNLTFSLCHADDVFVPDVGRSRRQSEPV